MLPNRAQGIVLTKLDMQMHVDRKPMPPAPDKQSNRAYIEAKKRSVGLRKSTDELSKQTPVEKPPEMISLRIVNLTYGIAHVRLPSGVHLRNIQVMICDDGSARLKYPRIVSRSGVDYGVAFALPPGQRERVEKAVAEVWKRATAADDFKSAVP